MSQVSPLGSLQSRAWGKDAVQVVYLWGHPQKWEWGRGMQWKAGLSHAVGTRERKVHVQARRVGHLSNQPLIGWELPLGALICLHTSSKFLNKKKQFLEMGSCQLAGTWALVMWGWPLAVSAVPPRLPARDTAMHETGTLSALIFGGGEDRH